MGRKILTIILVICCAVLTAELIFVGVTEMGKPAGSRETTTPSEITQSPATEQTEDSAATGAATTVPETTAEPTETEPVETEPREIRYTLTFAGDCTLAADPGNYASVHGFIQTIGEDYGYPFRNVLKYFENDDFTLINLESVLADSGAAASKLFNFRGPLEYTQIMTSSSVEGVTLANNHTMDYGQAGYDSTTKALTEAGIHFVEEDKTRLITTESGLVIGLYADAFTFSEADIEKNIADLKDQGAEVVICAFHWGTEGSYRPTADQKKFAHAAIDAGADVVYGHHPHVLQPMEVYGDGIIFYSLGNFSFGGNHFPRDLDSALVQVEVIRDTEGNVSLGQVFLVPVSISSMPVQNNFQPTPYEEGSEEYDRTMSKLDGTFKGPDLNVNYDHLKPTEEPTEAPTEPAAPPETQAPPATEAPADPPADPPADDPADEPADPPADPPADTPADPPADPPAENPPAET